MQDIQNNGMPQNATRLVFLFFMGFTLVGLLTLIGCATDDHASVHPMHGKIEAMQGLEHPLEINIDPSRVAHSRAKFLPSPPPGKVTVQLQASSVDAAIPGAFKFHLAVPKSGPPFTTVSLVKGEPIPRGTELVDGIAFVEPGKFYKLVVVYENPTNKDINFYVGAPLVDPEAALPFARALCWCAAISFKAPAGGAFYRTIKVGVAANTPPGAKAIVNWPVVKINQPS